MEWTIRLCCDEYMSSPSPSWSVSTLKKANNPFIPSHIADTHVLNESVQDKHSHLLVHSIPLTLCHREKKGDPAVVQLSMEGRRWWWATRQFTPQCYARYLDSSLLYSSNSQSHLVTCFFVAKVFLSVWTWAVSPFESSFHHHNDKAAV